MKLDDARIEQLRGMRKDGKTYQEIKDFFKEAYATKLNDPDISRAAKGVSVPKMFKKRGKRGSYKKTIDAAIASSRGTKVIQAISGCPHRDICRFVDICEPEICKFVRR